MFMMNLRTTKSPKFSLPLNVPENSTSVATSQSTSASAVNTPLPTTSIKKRKRRGFLLFSLFATVIRSKMVQTIFLNVIIISIFIIRRLSLWLILSSYFFTMTLFILLVSGPIWEFQVKNVDLLTGNNIEVLRVSRSGTDTLTSAASMPLGDEKHDVTKTESSSTTPVRVRLLKFIRKNCIPLFLKQLLFEIILTFRLIQSNFNSPDMKIKNQSNELLTNLVTNTKQTYSQINEDREQEKLRLKEVQLRKESLPNPKDSVNRHSIFSWFNPIDDNLLLGAIPLRELGHHSQLTSFLSLSAVISLNMPWEMQTSTLLGGKPCNADDWHACGVTWTNFPCEDFEPVPFEVLEHGETFFLLFSYSPLYLIYFSFFFSSLSPDRSLYQKQSPRLCPLQVRLGSFCLCGHCLSCDLQADALAGGSLSRPREEERSHFW